MQAAGCDVQPSPVSQSGLQPTTLKQLALSPHVTSHAHDEPHEMPEHELLPVQRTSHGPGPQATLRHAKLPLHSTLQLVDDRQLMPLRQELDVLHLMSQL